MEKYRYTLCDKYLRLNLDEVPSRNGKNIQNSVQHGVGGDAGVSQRRVSGEGGQTKTSLAAWSRHLP